MSLIRRVGGRRNSIRTILSAEEERRLDYAIENLPDHVWHEIKEVWRTGTALRANVLVEDVDGEEIAVWRSADGDFWEQDFSGERQPLESAHDVLAAARAARTVIPFRGKDK
ncbi:MAG TPA: hypothetical protein EYF98_10840 [Planctomycetes bacterium]|nr:hypothetical protein [Planctomycetota bacterium]